ncbi:MAG: DNA mismatch repair protein MutS [Bacteroidetes bacterium]|nr:MAG: DNA mismatch repair protein MutS [Bacteroidota bacterium]RLD70046.1 MAG: DNA mismatch repair protein MutS [Bacteroidota bacterium]RLD91813.1 MAG: DNA mismatch repair protein MutS [Bacteroidota bacterium]
MPKNIVETPLMKQYYSVKASHPDAVLLFRVGDFYETFGEDAIQTAEILGITLTKRANGAASHVELAGFPHHALDTYLPKLVRAGQRVAICEQLEDPKLTKKIVKRGITELVTPGLTYNENVLDNRENNFLASVYMDQQIHGIAFLDISTGEFLTSQGDQTFIDKLLTSFKPKEVLVQRSHRDQFLEVFGESFYTFLLEEWVYTEENARDKLQHQFSTQTLKGFGVQDMTHGIIASGAILQYLDLTQHSKTGHISSLSRIEQDHYVWLDRFTIRNLEIFNSLYEGAPTLIDVMDQTLSPMGSRLMKRWLTLPLKDVLLIRERHNMVEHISQEEDFREFLNGQIRQVGDLERIISKVAVGRVSPRELIQLLRALEAIGPLKERCEGSKEVSLQQLASQLDLCLEVKERIEKEMEPEPPALINKGGVIAGGVSKELDELREIMHSGKDYLVGLQQREMERTGITSLKIAYNNVFGYYIEVRNTHKDKVPEEWIRKQTLVSAERYITEELKEYEEKILGAEEKCLVLEAQLYQKLVADIGQWVKAIQLNASLVARLDCLLSFAVTALDKEYCRPDVNNSTAIEITEGRHPVIEQQLPADEVYVSNNVRLDEHDEQIMILTGPNMSGKSAFLRQVALITLMAQVGSFVPAEAASIGWVDKIFTRVGASDNISLGESTFMVEMLEAASILNNLSERSLVILDEIGRGTSTYDGISIAWAMVEYIHEKAEGKAKTLFATHYHELNEMEASFPRVRNYNVSIKELDNRVIFLRKLLPGGSEHSFGIHVAQMAGMPKSVVKRANEILKELERTGGEKNLSKPVGELAGGREGLQMSFFQLDDPILKQIRDQIAGLDINNLTPVEALNKLNEIKKLSGL